MFPVDLESSAQPLVAGEVVMAYGWPYDAMLAQQQSDAIAYVLPVEGTILYSENLIIPANSPRKRTAEAFINFLLRPEISAWFVNEMYMPTTNEAARALVEPEILNDPLVFPPDEVYRTAEVSLPLSPAGEALRADVWARFLAACGEEP
jgi:spermidine/putrescine transport system substrate-binding protein